MVELPPMEESFQDKKARIIEQERAKARKERILEINHQLKAISPQMARFISTQNYEMVRQFKEKAEQLQKEKDALIPIALKEEEQKQNFCISLKAAILDEEKASKEYKEMAEKVLALRPFLIIDGQKFNATNFYEDKVLEHIAEDEAKHKLHLEQIEKDLGCKNG